MGMLVVRAAFDAANGRAVPYNGYKPEELDSLATDPNLQFNGGSRLCGKAPDDFVLRFLNNYTGLEEFYLPCDDAHP